jgi:arylsulfatase A-like enzyme
VDLFPTLCEAIGAEIPAGVQGRSLWPLLTGQSIPANEFRSAYAEHGFGGLPYSGGEELNPQLDGFKPGTATEWGRYDCLNSRTQSGITRMVRMGDWKLSCDSLGRGQLYHLTEDPVELRNLFDRPEAAAKRQELMTELLTWMLRVQDPLPLPGVSNGRQYKTRMLPHNYWNA